MRDEGGENKKSQCVFIFLNVFKIEGKNNNDDETLRGGGKKRENVKFYFFSLNGFKRLVNVTKC